MRASGPMSVSLTWPLPNVHDAEIRARRPFGAAPWPRPPDLAARLPCKDPCTRPEVGDQVQARAQGFAIPHDNLKRGHFTVLDLGDPGNVAAGQCHRGVRAYFRCPPRTPTMDTALARLGELIPPVSCGQSAREGKRGPRLGGLDRPWRHVPLPGPAPPGSHARRPLSRVCRP